MPAKALSFAGLSFAVDGENKIIPLEWEI